MAIDATASREEKFRWLQAPLDHSVTLGLCSQPLTVGLATSGCSAWTVVAWQTAVIFGMVALTWAGQLRMSRAAGKL